MEAWINLDKYTPIQLFFNGFGCALWLVLYGLMAKNIYKYKFVEMPVFAAIANFAWEILWGTIFQPDTGLFFVWAYRGAVILDVYIFYHVYIYGHKQIQNPLLKKYFKPISIFGLFSWMAILYFFKVENYDTLIGATSGYILNLIIPILYIVLILTIPSMKPFSYAIAWLNMVATGFITVSMFMIYPQNHFIHTMAIVVLILGCVYIYLFKQRKDGKIPGLAADYDG